MNSLETGLIRKSGYANGWELCLSESSEAVLLASARHPEKVKIAKQRGRNAWFVELHTSRISAELIRSFPECHQDGQPFQCRSESQLGQVLRRAAELAHSLPNQAASNFHDRLAKELERIKDTGTEAERIVKQRIGQDAFRDALMEYWGGTCAVTGVSIPEVLRSSHAKPWSHCETDEERLNVYNGFLLSANLDALFDKGLITFAPGGELEVAPHLAPNELSRLSVGRHLKLRWIDPQHLPFLKYHRTNVFKH